LLNYQFTTLKLERKHFDSGQWADAARYFELFRRNFSDEPGAADVVYDLGKAYEQLGQVNLAVAVYEQFLSKQPSAKIQEELEKLQSKL
jgi:outer membrane protein assembly factor BamD (BamD/ComL family)